MTDRQSRRHAQRPVWVFPFTSKQSPNCFLTCQQTAHNYTDPPTACTQQQVIQDIC